MRSIILIIIPVRSAPPFWQHKTGLPIDMRVTMGTMSLFQSSLPITHPATPLPEGGDKFLDLMEAEWRKSLG